MSGMIWTQEARQVVIEDFLAGQTYDDIAAKFKTSRNSIGGLINRIREKDPKALPRITKAEFRERIAKRKPQVSKKPRAPYKPRKAKKLAALMIAYDYGATLSVGAYDGCEPTSFIDLKADQCKFGIDSPPAGQMSQMMCCGAKREGSSSYCQHHIDLSTRPSRGEK